MPGKKKSDWSVKFDELEAKLPKGFDQRNFRSCRLDGKWQKDAVAKVCDQKGFKGKAEDVTAFLLHVDEKPTPVKRSSKAKKESPKNDSSINFLAKTTYSELSHSDIVKLIGMLAELEKKVRMQEIERKDREIARLTEERDVLNRVDD